jgi:peroxiredoxin
MSFQRILDGLGRSRRPEHPRSRKGWRVAAGLAAAALALAGCTSGPPSTTAASGGRLLAAADRTNAPDLRGDLLAGGTFDLADHKGDVVVVNFWASWCSPCWAEADDLERTYQSTKDRGVAFVGVDIRDQPDHATAFVRKHSVSYPTIFDPPGRVALGFDVSLTAIPSTVLIDRAGRVAMVISGAVLSDTLEPLVTQLVAESP